MEASVSGGGLDQLLHVDWVQELPEDLDVCIAQRDFEAAVDLIQKSTSLSLAFALSPFPKCIIITGSGLWHFLYHLVHKFIQSVVSSEKEVATTSRNWNRKTCCYDAFWEW